MVHTSRRVNNSWWLTIALRGPRPSVVAVAGMLMLLTGCPETSPTTTSDDSSVNENSSADSEQPAELQVFVATVSVVITPDGAGQVLQTDLGFSRIQLFALPTSSNFVFDGWSELPTSENPIIIVATPETIITAEFLSVHPPSEETVGGDEP